MNSKTIIALMFVLFMFGSANAIIFDEFTVMIDKLDQDVSEITYLLVLSENGEQTISFELFDDQEGLTVYDKQTSEALEYTFDDNILTINVDFGESKQKTIVVKSFSKSLVDIKNGENVVSIRQSIPENVSKFELIATLPEGMILADVGDSSLIFPEPTSILSDGKRIILDWKSDFPDQDFEIFVTYKQVNVQNNNMIYVLLVVIIAAVAIIGFSMTRFNKKVKKVISIGLSTDEKKIYDFIKEKKEVKQKELLKEFDFSKPRLSKLVRNLETKNLISKEPKGRTNVLKIKEI